MDELLRLFETTEAANGFGNRILWVVGRRSKLLPEGGRIHKMDFSEIEAELGMCAELGRRTGEMTKSEDARKLWAHVYPELSAARPGLFGAMIGRAEAQTMRLACLAALMDRSDVVEVQHLETALALWDYCEKSTRRIFGEALGDPVADGILCALKNAPDGLTGTEVSGLFNRHQKKSSIMRALDQLVQQGLITSRRIPTKGRPSSVWLFVPPGERN